MRLDERELAAARRAMYRGTREKSRLRFGDLMSWDRRQLRDLEKRIEGMDKKAGRRAIRNAHKASVDVLNEKARDEINKQAFGPMGKRYKRGGGTVERVTKGGKEKHVMNFRRAAVKKSSWSTRSWFTSQGVVTRTWLNRKHYLLYIGHMWEGGFTPGKGTKYQGTRVGAINWRYGVARKGSEERMAIARMLKAMRAQLEQGRTLTPGELRNVVGNG
jgi:hypothetical protein